MFCYIIFDDTKIKFFVSLNLKIFVSFNAL